MRKNPLKRLKSIGPGAFIAAAFIGPGTVTTCSIAGASFGYALLWGLLFSAIATIVLQEMAARLGIISGDDLGTALRKQFKNPVLKYLSAFLVIAAIFIGNTAYETGNILGGALGLQALTGIDSIQITDGFSLNIWGPLIGIFAFSLLMISNYKVLEKILITLVILMSFTFIFTAIIVLPDLSEILKGMFIPRMPKGSILNLVGLVGTTVVPYNLFLHSSAVKERWKDESGLKEARTDLFVSIILGALISMAIVITSASAFYGTDILIKNAGDLAIQLHPLLGNWAKGFMGIGLFSAGISSSITAPLAAAYAVTGILGWSSDLKGFRFRAIWIFILLIGIVFSAMGFKPINAILFAQITNGILLPIIAIFLLWIVNNEKVLGKYVNSRLTNIIGIIVVLISLGLGLRSILSVIGII